MNAARSGSGALRQGSRLTLGIGALLVLATLAVQIGAGASGDPPWRRLWFDALHQAMPRERAEMPAVVVDIDDTSLSRIGQWPWPRNVLAELIDQIHRHGGRAIALDIVFSETDRMSPAALGRWLSIQDRSAAEAIAALGDTDIALAEAIRRAPVALASAGIRAEGPLPEHPEIGPRVIAKDIDQRALESYDHGIGPIGLFRPVAAGFGAISHGHSPDGILRKVPLVQRIVGRPYLLLGPEALRIAEEAVVARIGPGTLGLSIEIGETRVPVEADGSFWLHLGPFDPDRYVPAVEMLMGSPDALAAVKDRIVLVALTGLGTVDQLPTGLGERVYGVEAHLQTIEQIVEGRYLRRPDLVFMGETLLLVLLGGLAMVLIPRASPSLAIPVLLAASAAVAGLSALAFSAGLLVDAASPVLAAGIVGTAMTVTTLIDRDRARMLVEIALGRSRLSAARIDAELEAAGEIQASLLPPGTAQVHGALEIACHIRPARQVGGDFYDHFKLPDGRILILVGDVSGKGIEAAVFMGLSKALWKSAALRPGLSLAGIMTTANVEIARDNPTMMFVTAIVAVIEPGTGAIEIASAGHAPPYIFGAGTPRRIEMRRGPPAGLAPSAAFPVTEERLDPGEGICLFSDGVNEAENPGRDLYGYERLVACLATFQPGIEAGAAIRAIRHDVAWFAAGAAPSDDVTLVIATRPMPEAEG